MKDAEIRKALRHDPAKWLEEETAHMGTWCWCENCLREARVRACYRENGLIDNLCEECFRAAILAR